MRGNLAQANPILRQVEQLIYEADQLDREASVHLSQIEKNNDEVQILMTHALANVCFGGELMQSIADLQTQLTGLQSQLQEKKGDSKEKRRRVFQIRDEEDKYAIAVSYKEEEADEKRRQSEEAEHQAQRIKQEINSDMGVE